MQKYTMLYVLVVLSFFFVMVGRPFVPFYQVNWISFLLGDKKWFGLSLSIDYIVYHEMVFWLNQAFLSHQIALT